MPVWWLKRDPRGRRQLCLVSHPVVILQGLVFVIAILLPLVQWLRAFWR